VSLSFCFCVVFVLSCLAASLNLRINLKDLSRAADCGRMPPTVGDLLKTHESMSELDLHADACVQSPSALYSALDAWLCLLAKISVGVEGEHCSNHLLREKALRAARGRRELGSHIVACLRDTEKTGRGALQFYMVSRALA
jgi:hypothetical protein